MLIIVTTLFLGATDWKDDKGER